jgi:protocatechuate 3,4-dioxygenase, alpha subunit
MTAGSWWQPPSSSTEASGVRLEGESAACELTPFQPTGPYPQVMLDLPTGRTVPLDPAARGQHIVVEGSLVDGAGKPVADAMVETWQADASGCYRHPQDPRATQADPSFWGYRRVATDNRGRFEMETVKPGPTEAPLERAERTPPQAPHLLVAIYGGGILYRHVTRLYFDDEPLNAEDPVLELVPAHRRQTLLARHDGAGRYRFEIRLQGQDETVFFDV